MWCPGQFSLLFALSTLIAVDAGLLPIEQPFVATNSSHLGSRGNYFMVGFMLNVNRVASPIEPNVLISVSTTEPEPVSFTVQTKAFGTTSHMAIAGESTRIEIPADSVVVKQGNQRDKYVKIKAEEGKTISVYGSNDEQRSTDGFVALSCDGMDVGIRFERYEYAIMSGEIESSASVSRTVSEFLVIPCHDDTRVQIVPSQVVSVSASDFGTLRFGRGASTPHGFWELRNRDGSVQRPSAGETLLIIHSDDLTGTIIRSNKPVVVLSGHQCAQVPVGFTACDHLVDQIPPQFTWGYTFLLNPLAARESGDIYRVVTLYDETQVSVTCADEVSGENIETEDLGALSSLPGDNWLEYRTSPANQQPCNNPFVRKFCSLQSTKPVLVARYSQGYTSDVQCTSRRYGDLGDPFMNIIPPVVQYINNYLISPITSLAGTFPTRFVSISVYKTFFQPAQIMLGDSPVEPDPSRWNRIYCSTDEVCGYGIYKEISMGDHRVYHTNENAALGVELYGFQQQNSYGFPGGMEMEQLSGPIIRCQELYEIPESQGHVTITCTRSLDLSSDTRIQLTSRDRSAVGTMDYTPIDVELRFRGGQRQETVATTDVEIIQDGVGEPTEEFLVDVVATRNSIVLTPVVTVRIIDIGGCPSLPPFENGVVTETGRETGNTATYSCNTGFALVGDPVRTCQANGLWSTSPPVCRAPVSISIRIPDSRVQESDGTVNVELLLSRPATEDIQLNLLLQSGSAIAGSDFEDRVIPVTIPAGETRATVNVAIINDNLVEQLQEQFSVMLQLSSQAGRDGVVIGGTGEGTVEVIDDDIVIGFEETQYTVDESAGVVRLVVAVFEGEEVFTSGGMGGVQIRLNTQTGSAIGSEDYGSTTQVLEFGVSTTRQLVEIPILNNEETEDTEQFFAQLTLVHSDADVQLVQDRATIVIVDDDVAEEVEVSLAVVNPSVFESEREVTAIVSLSQAFSQDIQFTIETTDGTATVGADYLSNGGEVIIIPAGATEIPVTFTVVDDDIEEFDVESFGLSLILIGQPAGVTLGASLGTVTINDDDSVVIGFDSTEYTVEASASEVLVGVSILSGQLSRSLSVSLQTADDSAVAPTDYIATTQVLAFGPGVTQFTVAIPVTEEDDIVESVEQFFARLVLTDSNTDIDVELSPAETAIQITDNDVVVIGFERNLYSVDEATGQVVLGIVVLSGGLSGDVIINLETADSTAQALQDYTSSDVLLTFSSTSTRNTVPISITDDVINEGTEEFFARLSINTALSGQIELQPQQATVQISDNDGVVIGFRETQYTVVEATGEVVLNVEILSGQLSQDLVVRLNTAQDTARVSSDFTSTSQLLTFDGGSSSRQVVVTVTDDSVNEPQEMFSANLEILSSPVGGDIQLVPDSATITINDDDGVRIGFDRAEYSVEESAGTVTLVAQVLSGRLSGSTVVRFITRDDTAQAPEDYRVVGESLLTFSSTSTTQTVEVSVTNDNVSEGPERFLAGLEFVGSAINGIQLEPNEATVQINDDDRAVIGFERLLYFVEESEGVVVVTVGVQSGTLSGEVVVQLSTNSDTATARGDFASTTQQLTFSSTNTQSSVSIPIRDDKNTEVMEQFFASLSFVGDANIQFNPMTAVVMIDDDDSLTIGFDETLYSVDEGSGEVGLGVSILSGTLSDNLVVRVTTMERTATAPEDFVSVSTLLTFGEGVTRQSVLVTIVDDNNSESSEEFIANITLVDTDLEIDTTPGQTTVIIRDNDAPEPVFEFPVYTVRENDRSVQLCIDVGATVQESITYTITSAQKVPPQAEDADFGTSTTVTVDPSSSRGCTDFTDLVVDDSVALEGSQSFTIVVGSSTAMVNIIDDDVPEIQAPDVRVSESDGTAVICIKLGNEIESAFTVEYVTSVVSANENEDFISSADSLVINPGETESCVEIVITDDTSPESSETFSIDFTFELPPDVTPIPPVSSIVTIVDNDIAFGFDTTSYMVVEGVDSVVGLTLFRDGRIDLPAAVNITTIPGTASGGEDYAEVINTEVVFVAGTTEFFFNIPILDNNVLESTETFTVILTSSEPNVVITDETGTSTVTIVDNDSVDVGFDPETYMVTEGNQRDLRVVVSGSYDIPVEVLLSTTGLSATGDADYIELVAVPVTFQPGDSSQASVPLFTLSDNVPAEGDETLRAELTVSSNNFDPSRINLLAPRANVTITEEIDPEVSFISESVTVSEGEGLVEICLRLSVPLSTSLTVPLIFGSTGTTAISGLDYRVLESQVVFETGTVESCTEIEIVDDSLALERRETIVVSFTPPSGTQQGSPPSTTVTILDNDVFTIRFSEVEYSYEEGDTSAEVCLVGVGELAQQAMATIFSPLRGSATAGEDYVPVDLGVVFSVGVPDSQELCYPLTLIDDDIIEEEEYFSIEIVSASQGTVLGSPNVTNVNIIDNDVRVRFVEERFTVVEGEAVEVCVLAEGRIDSPFTVRVTTSDISAEAGTDYESTDILLEFEALASELTQSVCASFLTISDSISESRESFRVTLADTSDSRVTIEEPSSTVVEIVDNTVVFISFTSEGFTVSEDVETTQVCLRLSSPLPDTLIVPLSFNNPATASTGLDYRVLESQVVFEIGTVESCTEIEIVDDSLALERRETIVVSFTPPTGTQQGNPPSTTVTILDNDEFVVNFVEDYRYGEREGDTFVCVEGSGELAHPVTVTVTSIVGLGTASEGQDIFPVESQTVTFAPNRPSLQEVCFPVVIFDDEVTEREEFFTLGFESVTSGVVIGTRNTTTITIVDNDEVNVRFEVGEYSVTEGGVVELCVVAQGQLDSTFITLIQSSDLTAFAPTDYTGVTQPLVFDSGVGRVCFDVSTTGDSIPEDTETFRVSVISVSDSLVTVVTPGSTVVRIIEEDVLTVRLEREVYTVTEGGSVEVCALLSSAASFTVSAGLLTADLSATVVEDYGDISGEGFTFQPFSTRDCITISTVDDFVIESNERFTVSLLNPISAVTVTVGSPDTAFVTITDNEEITAPPTTSVVCEISSTLQVTSFSASSAYTFSGLCDHWLVAPSLTSSGLTFYVAVNFATDQRPVTINRAKISYGDLELVSTASGEFESSLTPLTREDTAVGKIYTFSNNVLATTGGGRNTIQLRDIAVTVTHVYSPQGSERIRIDFEDSSLVPAAQGLCGSVGGALVFGDGSGQVADLSNGAQLEQFARSWLLPPRLQTSTVESCNAEEKNDTGVADPQFSVSTPANASEALCYEFHGTPGKYFNLISDTCTSVNAYFAVMPIASQGNRMTTVGIHAMQSEERNVLGSDEEAAGKCVDIRIEHVNCAAFVGERPLPDSGNEGEIRYRKYTYKGESRWRVNVPNCEAEDYIIKVTCQQHLLRVDVNRKLHSISNSHGIMGQFWNVPLSVTTTPSGKVFVDINNPGDSNHRHVPARKYSMTWDHHHKTCYYCGNSQGGPEASRNQNESVIEGLYTDYQTGGLFDTHFKFKKFNDKICGV